MTDETITDLKQFIDATVYQHTESLRKELKADIENVDRRLSRKIDDVDNRLSQKIDDLSAGVGDALAASNQIIEEGLVGHERRIARLERKIA